MSKKRVFSGIRPTGEFHIGNYLGALKNWKSMEQEYDCVFGIVDYHALTTPFDAKELPQNVFNSVAGALATGLDPEQCMIIVQSDVPEHTELSWILSCLAPLGQMERMTQFKEKSQQQQSEINFGLLAYPALMAADILVYRAEAVPVGDDQTQHLELTRDLARKFNNAFGEYFVEPEPILSSTPRIMGLDGKSKMSKSLNNHISLFEEVEPLKKKVMSALTDENRLRKSDPGNPDVCNVYSLHKIFSNEDEVKTIDQECRSAGIGCVDCKKKLLGHLHEFVTPFRDRYKELQQNPNQVQEIAKAGAEKARPIAQETVDGVKSRMGIGKQFTSVS